MAGPPTLPLLSHTFTVFIVPSACSWVVYTLSPPNELSPLWLGNTPDGTRFPATRSFCAERKWNYRCSVWNQIGNALTHLKRRNNMSLGAILLIILILLLIGALPNWPYSSGWGYYPSSGLGVVVVIILILLLMGRL
jgi:hypothetical protein